MKKEKKKGSRSKTILIAFGIFIFLGIVGAIFGDDDKTDDPDAQNIESTENELATNSNTKEAQEPTPNIDLDSLAEPTPEPYDEATEENENPLGFNVSFSDTYRNDVTGNWRLARIAENIDIEEYAVKYYNNYFKSDNEIHIVINFTLNTTTRITVMGNLLDVSIMEYVDKEEHDAKLACSGMLLSEYHVNIDTGEIEKIQ